MEREEYGNRNRSLAHLTFTGRSRHEEQAAVAGLVSAQFENARRRIDGRTRTLMLDLDRPRELRPRLDIGGRRQLGKVFGSSEIELIGIVRRGCQPQIVTISNGREEIGIFLDRQRKAGLGRTLGIGGDHGNCIATHRNRMALLG